MNQESKDNSKLVWNVQTVFPAFHYGANNLQIMPEHGPFGMEAISHQKLNQTIGKDLISSVSLKSKMINDMEPITMSKTEYTTSVLKGLYCLYPAS